MKPKRYERKVTYRQIPMDEVLMATIWDAMGLPHAARSGPCWCNRGPGRDETHHSFCRKRRARWKAGLRALKKMGKFEDESL